MADGIEASIRQLRRSVATRVGLEASIDDVIDEAPASFYETVRRRLTDERVHRKTPPPAVPTGATGRERGRSEGSGTDPDRRDEPAGTQRKKPRNANRPEQPTKESRHAPARLVRVVLVAATVLSALAIAGFLLFRWLI